MPVFRSIAAAFRDFFSPSMLGTMIALPLLSLLFWGGLLVWFWTPWTESLTRYFSGTWALRTLSSWFPALEGSVGAAVAVVLVLLTVLPLIYLTTLLLVSQFVVPIVQRYLLKNRFPSLEKKSGGSFSGSLGNSLTSGGLYLVLFVSTSPLWLLPGAQILLPAALTAWLSRRVLTYDLLQDVATDEERRRLLELNGAGLWLLGFILGLLVIIPGLAFFVPVLAALAYGHFSYQKLQQMRAKSAS
ncbi:MAG: EI24 domain-containing protein [Bdellovibrionaceae bacterium]|nr:EI24 domain-containing protein [Pseudobdellovibrionaceae bacterium]